METKKFICLEPLELQRLLRHPESKVRRRAVCDIAFQKDPALTPLLNAALEHETDVRNRYEINRTLFLLNGDKNHQKPQATPLKIIKQFRQELHTGDLEQINLTFQRIIRQQIWELIPDMESIANENDSSYQKCLLLRFMARHNSDEYFENILSYLSDIDPHVVSAAIEVLEKIGHSAAAASITWFVDHPHHRIKSTALKALHSMGDFSAMELLEKMAKSDDSTHRQAAKWGLNALKKQKKPYHSHRNAKAVKNVIEKISQIKNYASSENQYILPTLYQLLRKDATPEIISAIISAIGYFRHTESIDILLPYLEHEDNRIRANAVQTLGGILPETQLDILKPFLEDAYHRVCASAIVALYKTYTAESLQALRKMAESLSEKEQLSAIYCMGAIKINKPAQFFHYLRQSHSERVQESLDELLKTLDFSMPEQNAELQFSLKELQELLIIRKYSFSNDCIIFQADMKEYNLKIEGRFARNEQDNWHCIKLEQYTEEST